MLFRLKPNISAFLRAFLLALCFPVVVTHGVWRLAHWATAGYGDRPAFYMAIGGIGAVGLHLHKKSRGGWWIRRPVRLVAWFLCFLGLIWFVLAGWILGAVLCLPFVATNWINRVGKQSWNAPLPPYAAWIGAFVGLLALVNMRQFFAAFGSWLLFLAPLAILLMPPLLDLPRRWRYPFIFRKLGLAGQRYSRMRVRPWWRRLMLRTSAWGLCGFHTVAFMCGGWLLAPRMAYFILGFPIAMTQLLERIYAKAAGPDWYKPGFRIATAFVGDLGLWLFRLPIERRWLRWPARWLAWPLCLLGLLWFRSFGWWAFLLVPLLRMGKHLHAAPLERPEPDYVKRPLGFRLETLDYISLSIVAFVGVMLWLNRAQLVTFAPDGYYHLLVARRIAEDGLVLRPHFWDYFREGIVPRWAWWEYAPQGRPHLYPPLLHVLVALLSLPFDRDVEEGMRILQVFVLPGTLLSTWYLGRWLFDARRGFIAMLLVGMGFFLVALALFALPSVLANVMLPFLLILFLKRRFWPVMVLMALLLYAHLGVGVLALTGLLLFSLWHREYLLFYLSTLVLAIVLALPWYMHVWAYRDWMGNPMAQAVGQDLVSRVLGIYMKMRWLLMLDLLVVLLVIRAWRMIPWFETRYRLLLCNVVGFLPMFFEYGGRYFFHTLQMWVIIAAVPLVRFVTPPLRVRRIALILLLAFLFPPLILSGNNHAITGLTLHPMLSGWTMTGIVMIAGNSWFGDGEEGHIGHMEAVLLGQFIERLTEADQIVYIAGDTPLAGVHLAVTLGYHANRRISTAAWPEVRPADPEIMNQKTVDSRGCYVSHDPTLLPDGFETRNYLGFFVALPLSGSEVPEQASCV